MSREKRKDYWSKPFKRMVVLGESQVWGGMWLDGTKERFADIVAQLIRQSQGSDLEYLNFGVQGNCISPRSPGYDKSTKPSALERYRDSVIITRPDLVLLCYGLNDMRAGMPIDEFIEDLETIVSAVKKECDALTVLTTVYHMTAYRHGASFDRGSPDAARRYNIAIRKLAKKHGCLLADVAEAEQGADWLIHPDGVHSNRVGNLVIACRVFETIARNCSGMTRDVFKRDLKTKWAESQMRDREKAGDPFNAWWK